MALVEPDPTSPPQVIPRPEGARPGGPPPWAALPLSRRQGLGLASVRTGLARAGREGRAPTWTETAVNPANDLVATAALGSPTPAAVLAALFEEEGEARVVLTRRSPALRAHRGEVSFPGGRLEPGEEVVTGALREASEEVGLDPAGVALAGWLTPVVTFNSRSFIHPVVATLEGRPHLSPNPAEVARVVDVALADLVADGVFDEERWPLPPGRPGPAGAADGTFPVWFFRARGELVWGATARMLYELCCLTLGVPTRWDEARSGT